jgi:hypothetical protein
MSEESSLQINLEALRTRNPRVAGRIEALAQKSSKAGSSQADSSQAESSQAESSKYDVVLSKTGLPVLAVQHGGRRVLLSSAADPRREAARLVHSGLDGDEQIVMLFGMGMGYHVEEILEFNRQALIVILEPDIELFAQVLKTRDLSKLLVSDRILILFEKRDVDLDEVAPNPSAGNIRQLILRPYRALYEDDALEAEKRFQIYSQSKSINIATLKRFDRLWTRNIFRNCSLFFTLKGLNELQGAASGVPALVVAAGPSIVGEIPLLKEMQDTILIIAVDTISYPLIRHGVIPDFIVTVDPQLINSHHLAWFTEEAPAEQLPVLIADPAVHATVFRIYTGPVVLTSSVFDPGKIIERFSGKKGSIAAGGSVATASFDLARILEADPIVIVGLDLSYKTGRTHFPGSLIERFIHARMTRLNPLLSMSADYMRGGSALSTKDRTGEEVLTDRRMLLYRSWFERQMLQETHRVLNATRGGLYIEGMEDIAPERIAEYACSTCGSKHELMDAIRSRLEPSETGDAAGLAAYLNETGNQLKTVQELLAGATRRAQALVRVPSESGLEELNRMEEELLSFSEPNRLISMVMQASIDRVLSGRCASDLHSAVQDTIDLYASMKDAAMYLVDLLDIAGEALQRKDPA